MKHRALLRSCLVVTALSTLVACGSRAPARASVPSITSRQIHAEVRDSSVDTLPDSRIPTSPDMVLGSVDVADGQVVFRVRLRPASFDPTITRFAIDLDIDQNASTGTSGVEYYVIIFPVGERGADIARSTTMSYTVVGTVPVTFVADGCDVTVPLALLGNDDGRFDFRMQAYAQPALPLVLDSLPDIGFARVQ